MGAAVIDLYAWRFQREAAKVYRCEMGVVWPAHLRVELVPAPRRHGWRPRCAERELQAALSRTFGGSWVVGSRVAYGQYRCSRTTVCNHRATLPPAVRRWVRRHDAQLPVRPLSFTLRSRSE